ncbi:hypothetical protein NE237_031170 [Protea cynaroides]|uniref:F-box domain-containing protein n=1 Tax=Protea cynaroides TaxID=273540 RepID=A0A9Q0L0M3_9MAGN|nr:hypothetical protein NE237_031170 [Protea cynaroides]
MAAAGEPHKPKDWSELPKDLIVLITERLSAYADHVRFSSVCFSWNSALARSDELINHSPSLQHQYFPLLVLPNRLKDTEDKNRCSWGLLSLTENGKIYKLHGLPKEFRSMHCPGSSHGWLVIVDVATPSINIFNPFTRAQLPLPPMDTFRSM